MNNVTYFSINTSKGKYEFKNTNLDTIRAALKETMPKLTDESIDRLFSNEANFVERKEETDKKNGGKYSIPSLPLTDKKNLKLKEYKELFKVANSLYAYRRNGHRQWGEVVSIILGDAKLAPYFNDFDKAFMKAYDAVNGGNDYLVEEAVAELTASLIAFKSKMDGHRSFKMYAEMEFINGNDRRLGMRTIVQRIPNVTKKVAKKAA